MTGVVRERSSKNKDLATGEIEVVPGEDRNFGKCIYNALPFESKDADENTRLTVILIFVTLLSKETLY